jgi:hypothetical protein
VLSDATGAMVWASNTGGQGAPPCSAVVSSAGGGALAVLDSTGVLLFLVPSPGAAPDPAVLQHRFNAHQTGAPPDSRSWLQAVHVWPTLICIGSGQASCSRSALQALLRT